MADIIIKGQAHEAYVRMNYDSDGYEYGCSKGLWCPFERASGSLDYVINDAIIHVDRHDANLNAGVPDGV